MRSSGAVAGFNGAANDSIVVSADGTAYYADGNNYFPDLDHEWQEAEFNVFGNSNGSQAVFNSGSTIVARTTTESVGEYPPRCAMHKSFTGEFNQPKLSGNPNHRTGDVAAVDRVHGEQCRWRNAAKLHGTRGKQSDTRLLLAPRQRAFSRDDREQQWRPDASLLPALQPVVFGSVLSRSSYRPLKKSHNRRGKMRNVANNSVFLTLLLTALGSHSTLAQAPPTPTPITPPQRTAGFIGAVYADPSDFVVAFNNDYPVGTSPCKGNLFHIRRDNTNFKELVAVALTGWSTHGRVTFIINGCYPPGSTENYNVPPGRHVVESGAVGE